MNSGFKMVITCLAVIVGVSTLASIILIACNPTYSACFGLSCEINNELAQGFGSLFGGVVGTLCTFISILLVIYTISNQNQENTKNTQINSFFKMIDYHNQLIEQMNIPKSDTKGRRVFPVYKKHMRAIIDNIHRINNQFNIQLKDEDILDVCYLIFYYGFRDDNQDETIILTKNLKDKLKNYSQYEKIVEGIVEIQKNPTDDATKQIGKTHQTNLSVYFRNMYNAIKLIDSSNVLSDKEKRDLIAIYRAQISAPELYIVFFHTASQFGNSWCSNKEKYIEKYELINYIPKDYCDGYVPKYFFKMEYESEDKWKPREEIKFI